VDSRTDAEGNSFSVNFKAVECNREEFFGSGYSRQTGSSADLMMDEGQQWLALYVSRNSLAGNPILADFAVQTESQAPSGLEGNVHLIGEEGAINIASGSFRNYSTFQRTRNLLSDKTLYMFYGISDTPKTYDESSGNMTATDLNSGTAALFGFGGMAIGAVLGAVLANMLRRKKESEAEAA
jgi:phosphotransferase system  glucose/maltose/N-acetylglucosamine-specific IIC component